MKEKQILKIQKGITLVALVITIVILIILATVSINIVFGDSGLIKKAQEAKNISEEKSFREDIELQKAEYSILQTQNDPEVNEKLYKNLKEKGYEIFDVEGNEITSGENMECLNEVVVKYKNWMESITIKNNTYAVSNEDELKNILDDISNNSTEIKPIEIVNSLEINEECKLKDIEIILREDITLTVNNKINVKGKTSIVGKNKDTSVIKRGNKYIGAVILGDEAETVNISNLTLLGNGTWTGEYNETLDRGTTYSSESGMSKEPIFSVGYNSNSCDIIMNNVVVRNCATTEAGGNIYLGRPGNIEITNCEFINNNSGDENNIGSAGTIWITSFPKVKIENCTFSGNSTYGNTYYNGGGAIRIQNGYVDITKSIFENNGAFDGNYGGAIYINNGTLLIENSQINNNYASVGAAIRVSGGDLEVNNTIFKENKSKGVGAVLSGMGYGSKKFNQCEIYNNKGVSSSGMGGIFWSNGSLILDSCSVKANKNNNVEFLSEAIFAPMLTIKGNMEIDSNTSFSEEKNINTNIYVGKNFKTIKISGKLTQEGAVYVNVDSSIQEKTILATSVDGYVLTEEDLKAFNCDNEEYILTLNSTDNVIEVSKK